MTEQILGSLNKTLAEKKKEKYDTTLEKKIRENIGNLLPEVCVWVKVSGIHFLQKMLLFP